MANKKIEFDTDGFQYYNDNYVKHPSKSATTGTSGSHPYNGMGRVVLKKNMVSNVNTLTQAMINTANTIYVIKYDYVLGANITVPANCVLEFDGGSISAGSGANMGTITGNNTKIIYSTPIFTGIKIQGTWNVPVLHSWMFTDIHSNMLRQLFYLTDDNVQNTVIIEKTTADYVIGFEKNPAKGEKFNALTCTKNTDVIINGVVKLDNGGYRPSYGNAPTYRMIILANNCSVSGEGSLVGDLDNTHPEYTEFGVGIMAIADTGYIDAEISGIKIADIYGSAIGISHKSRNIHIHNVEITNWNSNGISIIEADNCNIHNIYFHDGGYKDPWACIDFEPNAGATINVVSVRDITADNVGVVIRGSNDYNGTNHGGASASHVNMVSIENVDVKNPRRHILYFDGAQQSGELSITNVICEEFDSSTRDVNLVSEGNIVNIGNWKDKNISNIRIDASSFTSTYKFIFGINAHLYNCYLKGDNLISAYITNNIYDSCSLIASNVAFNGNIYELSDNVNIRKSYIKGVTKLCLKSSSVKNNTFENIETDGWSGFIILLAPSTAAQDDYGTVFDGNLFIVKDDYTEGSFAAIQNKANNIAFINNIIKNVTSLSIMNAGFSNEGTSLLYKDNSIIGFTTKENFQNGSMAEDSEYFTNKPLYYHNGAWVDATGTPV